MASKPPRDPDPGGLFAHDRELGTEFVAGADEAGRGCLAGPIVAAAVVFGRRCLDDRGSGMLIGINDSKKMTARARERLYPHVLACATRVAVVVRSARYIDANGLHASNVECLSLALERVGEPGGSIVRLADGFRLEHCRVEHRKLVNGDSTSAAVAAASVVAKVTRDRCMVRAGDRYPGYGFERHKGYASPAHRQALTELGASGIHRLSFNSAAYS